MRMHGKGMGSDLNTLCLRMAELIEGGQPEKACEEFFKKIGVASAKRSLALFALKELAPHYIRLGADPSRLKKLINMAEHRPMRYWSLGYKNTVSMLLDSAYHDIVWSGKNEHVEEKLRVASQGLLSAKLWRGIAERAGLGMEAGHE